MKWNLAAFGAASKGDIENLIVASTPGGIEAQEARGQTDFVNRELMPVNYMHGGMTAKELYEGLGFVVGDIVDDIFYSVSMPTGWTKRATSHSMWSEVLDAQGRNRMSVFYKAAFYDRSAHVSPNTRYVASTNAYKDDKPEGAVNGIVADCGVAIWTSDPVQENPEKSWEASGTARDLAVAWANEHYPDWQNPFAYWDVPYALR